MKYYALISYSDGLIGIYSDRVKATSVAERHVANETYARYEMYISEAVLDR